MKKILTLSFVLASTIMFANGTDEKNPAASTSGAAVIKNGESTFRVIYKSEKESDVKVSILDERNKVVFVEKVSKTDGFTRPYNFSSLKHGEYTIAVEDASGMLIERVVYRAEKSPKALNVIRVNSDEGKYVLTAAGSGTEAIAVNIYDENNRLIHHDTKITTGNFAQLYNLKSIKGHVTFEITNESGDTKTVAY